MDRSKSTIRVLDLSMFWAGSTCAQLLADTGMEVIKIESCGHPDPDRIVTQGLLYLNNELGDDPWNRGMVYLRRHRNKLSIALDLATEEGRELFLKLVKISDIVVENFRRGVLEKLRISYDILEKVNPKVLLISVSSQGEKGPERTYGSNAETLAFVSGIRSITDYTDEVGMFTAANIPDPMAGTMAAGFALAALRNRNRTGKGAHVVLSQRALLTSCIGDVVMDYVMNKRVPCPQGNSHPVFCPHGCYPCAGNDAWIAISIKDDKDWLNLCRLIGDKELLNNGELQKAENRLKHRDELDRRISLWTKTYEARELTVLLQGKNIASFTACSAGDLLSDRHLIERGFWEEVEDNRPGYGNYICKGRGFYLSKTPLRTYRRAPAFGEHNSYVFRELLGLTAKEVNVLEQKGIIGNRPSQEELKRIPRELPAKKQG